MMSTSYNEPTGHYPISISSLMYRDVGISPGFIHETTLAKFDAPSVDHEETEPTFTAREVQVLENDARAEAIAETENRMRNQCRAGSEEEAAKIRHAIELFQTERKEYFDRVESDVVHLALAIAGKILHREAQVDPMLIAGLVRVAIDKLHDGSSVSVRVPSSETEKWKTYLANPLNGSTVQIIADDNLGPKDCVLETDLGSANFSIDAQLKEVEQGFFDLLAQRPAIK
jgi:flagellar assembly protein FliH